MLERGGTFGLPPSELSLAMSRSLKGEGGRAVLQPDALHPSVPGCYLRESPLFQVLGH